MLEFGYKYYPFIKGTGCILIVCLSFLSVYFYPDYKDKLPGFIILFGAVPFAIGQLYLFKSFYYFKIFSDRSILELKNNQKLLKEVISEKRHFILYLRNHSLENGAVVETILKTTGDADLRRGLPFYHLEITDNVFEDKIIKPLIEFIPVFTLHSPADDRKSVAKRILTKRKNWLKDARFLIDSATFIMLNYETNSEGVIKELEYIYRTCKVGKTLIFTSKLGLESLNKSIPTFAAKAKSVNVVASDLVDRNWMINGLQLDFIEEVKQLTTTTPIPVPHKPTHNQSSGIRVV